MGKNLRLWANIVNVLEFAAILGSGVIFSLVAGDAADKILTKERDNSL